MSGRFLFLRELTRAADICIVGGMEVLSMRRGVDSTVTFVVALAFAAVVAVVGIVGMVAVPWWLALGAAVAWGTAALALVSSGL